MDIAEHWGRLGFRDIQPLGIAGQRALHRVHDPQGQSRLAVALRSATATDQARHAMRRHHALLEAVDCPALPAMRGWQDADGLTGYLAEDTDGVPLEHVLRDGPMAVADALRMGQQLAGALDALHAQGQVTLSLSPAQVLWCAASGRALLVDVGAARALAEVEHGLAPAALAGCDLAYLAPETSGRLGRAVDARADLYALGALLHRAIGGQPLFEVVDALGWVHAHLARTPRSLASLDARVPQVVSDIVARLLHKAPDSRYQSAWGLQADLARCVDALARDPGGPVAPFTLGADDFSTAPQPPARLYGREAALQALHAALDGLQDGRPRAVMLRGYSGIGKSALVQALQQGTQDDGVQFLMGKVDQFQRSQPYAAISDALAHAQVGEVRHRAFGADALAFVQALVPGFDRLRHPDVRPLPSDLSSAQTRLGFYQAAVGFVQMLVADGRRLVLFLDDLQWADLATLDLLEQWMLRAPVPGVLLVCAYRDNEVDLNHPVARMLERLAGAGSSPLAIVLAPLGLADVTAWLSDSLSSPADALQPLARLVAEKTSGNPFFVRRYLDYAYQQGLLGFDRAERRWRWSEAALREQSVMDNVVDLVVSQIGRLSAPTRRFLAVGAVAGAAFELDEAATLGELDAAAALAASTEALAAGFIRVRAGATHVFNHDRIQEAALRQLDGDALRRLHERMAAQLLARLAPAERERRLFEVMGHLVDSADAATPEPQRMEVARFALQAARRARLSNAPAEGLRYARHAIDVLGRRLWVIDPTLAFQLVREAQAAAFLVADLDAARRYFDDLEAHPAAPVEMAPGRTRMLYQLTMQGQYKAAVDLSKMALEQMGVLLDLEDPVGAMAAEMARFDQHVARFGHEGMLAYTRRDARIEASFQLIRATLPASFFYMPVLCPLLGLKAVNLAAQHRVAAGVGYPYTVIGFGYIGLRGDHVSASQACATGVALAVRQGQTEDASEAMHLQALIGSHWTAPIADALPLAHKAFEQLRELGGMQSAGYTFFDTLAVYAEGGYPLAEVDRELARALAFTAATRNLHAEQSFLACRQFVRALRGQTAAPASFDDAEFSEARHLVALDGNQMARSYHVIYKMMLAHYAGEGAQAWQLVGQAEPLVAFIDGFLLSASCRFHAALLRCRALREGWTDDPGPERERLDAALEQLERWAQSAPSTFAHRAALVRAERLRLDGAPLEALQQYELASAGAWAHGFRHEAGLALRLASQVSVALGLHGQAALLEQAAQQRFAQWGAHALVDEEAAQRVPAGTDGVAHLDLDSIIKGAEAIGGELDYDALIRKLVGVAIENAGGERAMLLGPDGASWQPLAWAEQHDDALQLATADSAGPLAPFPLPGLVLRRLASDAEPLLLDDAMADTRVAADPVVRARRIRSLVCVPLRRQQRTMGLLYVENTLAAGVFSGGHTRVLRVIAAQAAVTMESARLYGNLEREVARRTQELAAKNLALQTAQQALEQARDAAEEAARAKSDFLANMSHEIRTPMNAITGLARLLARAGLEPAHLDYVHKIQSSSQHLLGLLNDILDLSKVEAGKVSLEQVAFDLDQVLANLTTVLADKARDKGLALLCRVAPQVPRSLVGDPLRLGQILINYASNAIKFTERGEVAIDIRPEEAAPGADAQLLLRFEVRDTGIGLSEEQAGRMFQKFSQADSSTTRRYGGTGLGLAISKSLVELMGGEVGVHSKEGEGSTFWFTARLQVAPQAQAAPAATPAGQAVLREALRQRAGARLLLVEDNALNQLIAVELLRAEGFAVDVAENGTLAVDRVDAEPYDLVLMDMQMPVMDGIAATRAIRARRRHQDLPIVAMTANVMRDDRARCTAAGMNDHVDKPIEPEQLWAVLVRWLPGRGPDAGAAPAVAAAPERGEAAQAEPPHPPAVEGIDLAQGLRRAGGNQALFRRMLERFCDNQAETVASARAALARGDRDAAERAAHTLKGLAATIGAGALHEAAAALEQGLHAGAAGADGLQPQFDGTQAALQATLATLRAHLAAQQVHDGAAVDARPDMEADASGQAAQLLAQLTSMLQASSAEAPELLGRHAGLFAAALGDRFARVRTLVDGFDFEEALDALRD